ncbi:hypothetical protein CspeluHIS016_0211950 [Cutaneotrichosporon spelunceum]|uniref:SCP domain-containing protein n=1 Tax=Cutaneotrichosporon spelunceum TaxID=1672016 RepID=A0AAD3YBT8_9TREE|nr:hypothetical protein CspeluHIS016_0211950 [Cutaneotrichosporon spelunceum]
MTQFLVVVLAALAATASAGPVGCRPRPKSSTSVSVAPSVSASAPPPAGSEGANGAPSASVPTQSVTSGSAVGSAVLSQSDPAPSNSVAAVIPPPGAIAPPGVDKSKPWLPLDPNNNTITANPSAADISGSSPTAAWLLEYHNTVRAMYGAAPLKWDQSLAQQSADWTKKCNWEHDGNDNLARRMSTGMGPGFLASAFLDGWTNEWPETFAGGNAATGKPTALNHLTMMVWKDVTAVGCSWNMDCKGGWGAGWENTAFLSCKYAPLGNIVGQQGQQVGNFIPG